MTEHDNVASEPFDARTMYLRLARELDEARSRIQHLENRVEALEESADEVELRHGPGDWRNAR